MTDVVYERLDTSGWRNVWLVGDLHGHIALLMEQLDAVLFDTRQDLLICTGDLIDRGPDSLETLRLIRLPWFRTVRGNHEQMAFDTVVKRSRFMFDCWLMNGGRWYLALDEEEKSAADALILETARLPHVLELRTPTETIVVCHGDYPGQTYQYGQNVSAERVLWGRDRIDALAKGKRQPLSGADRFFFGHTPARRPRMYANLNYIDVGCASGLRPMLMRVQRRA